MEAERRGDTARYGENNRCSLSKPSSLVFCYNAFTWELQPVKAMSLRRLRLLPMQICLPCCLQLTRFFIIRWKGKRRHAQPLPSAFERFLGGICNADRIDALPYHAAAIFRRQEHNKHLRRSRGAAVTATMPALNTVVTAHQILFFFPC